MIRLLLVLCFAQCIIEHGHSMEHPTTVSDNWNSYTFAIPRLHATANPQVLLSTSSSTPASVLLTVPAIHFTVDVNITRNKHSQISLPSSVLLTGNGTHDTTVVVHASQLISIHVIDSQDGHGDGCIINNRDSNLGTLYYVTTYTPFSSVYPALVTISALADNTVIDISTRRGGHLEITIDALDTYQLLGSTADDLTGARIESSKPVSVMAGVRLTMIPVGYIDADGILEQLLPVANWGRHHILAPFMGRDSGYIYRVVGANITTTLNISRIGTVVINEGEWFEGDVTNDDMVSIVSDNSVSVMQFMKSYTADSEYTKGDPSMITVPAVENYGRNLTFPVLQYAADESQYYVTITIECRFLKGLTYDDEFVSMTNWDSLQTIDGTMCAVRNNVTSGLHSVGHGVVDARFTVAVYGLDRYRSYAYLGGLSSDYAVLPTSKPTTIIPVTSEPGQEIPEMTLICDGTNMTAIFNASVIPYIHPSDVNLFDPECIAVEYDETHAMVSTNYDMCRTQTTMTNDHVVYSNALVLGLDDPSSPILPTEVSFECRLDRRHLADTSYRSSLTKYVSYGNFTYDLSIYEDATYVTPYDEYPVAVRVGDTLHLAGRVNNLNRFALFLDSCWATPTANPWHDISYALVTDGCAVDDTFEFYDSGDPSFQQFSFRAFAFRDGNWLIYVHCQMLVCDNDDSTSRCSKGCQEAEELVDARMRRSLPDLKTVSSGPLVVRRKKD